MGRRRRPSDTTVRVLAFLLENQHREYYGLEIATATKLQAGTLYPILARLERDGWIEGEWEHIDPAKEGRRPRKYYHLTPKGVPAARDAVRAHLEPSTQTRFLVYVPNTPLSVL